MILPRPEAIIDGDGTTFKLNCYATKGFPNDVEPRLVRTSARRDVLYFGIDNAQEPTVYLTSLSENPIITRFSSPIGAKRAYTNTTKFVEGTIERLNQHVSRFYSGLGNLISSGAAIDAEKLLDQLKWSLREYPNWAIAQLLIRPDLFTPLMPDAYKKGVDYYLAIATREAEYPHRGYDVGVACTNAIRCAEIAGLKEKLPTLKAKEKVLVEKAASRTSHQKGLMVMGLMGWNVEHEGSK